MLPGVLHTQLSVTGLDVSTPNSQGSKQGILLCPKKSERGTGRSEKAVELAEGWGF